MPQLSENDILAKYGISVKNQNPPINNASSNQAQDAILAKYGIVNNKQKIKSNTELSPFQETVLDYTNYADEGLNSLNENIIKPAVSSLPELSPFGKSVVAHAGEGLNKLNKYVIKPINSVTTDPIRASLGAASKGAGLIDSLKAGANQFGNLKDEAPNATQILENYGFPQDSPTIKALGTGIDTIADIGGFGAFGKGLGQLGKYGKYVSELRPGEGLIKGANAVESGKPLVDSASQVEKIINPEIKQFNDLKKVVEEAKANGMTTDLPTAAEFNKAEGLLSDLKLKALPGQKAALADRQTNDVIKAFRDLPSKQSKTFGEFENLQKQELSGLLGQEVKKLNPNTLQAQKSGEDAISDFLKKYESTKAENIPQFKAIDAVSVPPNLQGNLLGNQITKDLGIKQYFIEQKDALGRKGVSLFPYQSKMGIDKGTYNLISDTINEANNSVLNVKDLRNIRENLRGAAEVARGRGSLKEAREIEKVRDSMLTHIEKIVDSASPDLNVRQTFKNWAINEKNKEMMTKALSGSLDPYSLLTDKVVPEKVISKIFSNTNNIKLFKQGLGKDFNKITGNFLDQAIADSTDKGILSSQKLASVLRKNDAVLKEALSDNPQAYDRVKAITDYMRLGPDSPTTNPSGTAKSVKIMEALTEVKNLISHPREYVGQKIANRGLIKEAEGLLFGKKKK